MKKYLIIGLGNIGNEYFNTRHNIGFLVIDNIAKNQNITLQTQKLGDLAEFSIKGRKIILLKPSTYMNLSGKAINYWMNKENIPLENILVICDDLNIPFPSIRIKKKGSDGGHNGLKNIQQEINSQDYARMRFGISANYQKGQQIDYVLGEWSPEELEVLPLKIQKMSDAVTSFVLEGIDRTMNSFNSKE